MGAPAGWPEGTDEQTSMDKWVADKMADFEDPTVHIDEPVSPAVQKFREMIQ